MKPLRIRLRRGGLPGVLPVPATAPDFVLDKAFCGTRGSAGLLTAGIVVSLSASPSSSDIVDIVAIVPVPLPPPAEDENSDSSTQEEIWKFTWDGLDVNWVADFASQLQLALVGGLEPAGVVICGPSPQLVNPRWLALARSFPMNVGGAPMMLRCVDGKGACEGAVYIPPDMLSPAVVDLTDDLIQVVGVSALWNWNDTILSTASEFASVADVVRKLVLSTPIVGTSDASPLPIIINRAAQSGLKSSRRNHRTADWLHIRPTRTQHVTTARIQLWSKRAALQQQQEGRVLVGSQVLHAIVSSDGDAEQIVEALCSDLVRSMTCREVILADCGIDMRHVETLPVRMAVRSSIGISLAAVDFDRAVAAEHLNAIFAIRIEENDLVVNDGDVSPAIEDFSPALTSEIRQRASKAPEANRDLPSHDSSTLQVQSSGTTFLRNNSIPIIAIYVLGAVLLLLILWRAFA